MATLNPNNRKQTQTSLFGGASGPTPVNPAPPYSFQGGHLVNGNPAPVATPTGSSFVDPNLSYGANVVHAGAAASGGSTGGTTDEGVVIGSGATPTPTVADTSSDVDLSYSTNAGSDPDATPMSANASADHPPVVTPPTETETPPLETPPTDTSGSEGGGTSTPTDTTIDSYYDYLETEMPEHLKDIYNDTIAAIDQANAKTIAEINAAKERGIVDANTSYEQNKATYGANAEALASMGLTGGGYSDYLNAQAYAAQRDEVQGVKASALAAENNANATADAQKLEAKTALDKNLLFYDNLAEQHLEGKWSDILTGAGNGTYSKEQVENLAKYYGFSDEQIAALTGAVDSYEAEKAAAETKEEKAYADKMFGVLLGGANTGEYNADQLASLADTYGLSPEQKQALIDAVNGYTAKTEEATKQQQTQNKNEIGGYITGETTDEEIQDYVDEGYISEEDAEELKKDREKAAINEINSYISSGDFSTMQSKADSAYNNGYISKQQYQKLYYDACIKNCQGASSVSDVLRLEADLTNLKNAGKLTGADYNNAVKYLYSRAGSTLSYKAKYGHNVFGGEVKNGQLMEVTMNGETYDISTDISGTTGNFVDKDTAKVLAGICGNSYSNGSMAKLGDTIYVYRTGLNNGSGWVKVNTYSWGTINGTSKGFYEQYTKEIGYQPSTSAPASMATNSAFQQIQSFIDSNNLREGDRARWGQAFKFAGLLDLYNTLTADEKAALKGKS